MPKHVMAIIAVLLAGAIFYVTLQRNNEPDFIREITSASPHSEQYYKDLSAHYKKILAWERSQTKQSFGAEVLAGDVSEQKAQIMKERDYIREKLSRRHGD